MIKRLIREAYREAVALAQVPNELKQSLKTSERVPRFIDNLTREIMKIPMHKRTPVLVKKLVYDYTDYFLKNVERVAKERMYSDIYKAELQKEIDRRIAIQKAADSGVIDEL